MSKTQPQESTAKSNTASNASRSSNDGNTGRRQTAEREVQKTAEEVKHQAEDAAQDIRRKGEELASDARERTERALGEQQQEAAEHVDNVAGALRRTADELNSDNAWVASGMARAANALDDVAQQLKTNDLGTLTQRMADYTRREPVVVLTGAAVAGFMLSRFMKSSTRRVEPKRQAVESTAAYDGGQHG